MNTQIATFSSTLLAVAFDTGEVGKRIKAARTEKHWTQMDLAREASVSLATVQRWERGQLPRVRELIRLAELLDVPVENLVEPRREDPTVQEELEEVKLEVARLSALVERLVS